MDEGHERDAPQVELSMPEGEEPPPPGARTMAVVRWVILAATIGLSVFAWWSIAGARFRPKENGIAQARAKYQCPMHPQIVSDEPGECPICHMQLQPMDSGRFPPASPPNRADAGTAAPAARSTSGASTPTAVTTGTPPPGTVPIRLALDRIQAIGVRTAVATEREVDRTLRVTAVIAAPEQGVAEVHVRASGFVEQISVTQTGVAVRGGQVLVGIYSPELYQAQTEFLTAWQWGRGDGGTRAGDAARLKLRLLGMSDRDVDRVIEKGEPMRAVLIYAPQGGVVSKKNVVLGSYVTPETALYEIQDLSHVYVVADVLQPDVGGLRVGVEGRFASATEPAAVAIAKVDLIYPTIGVETRTTRVRMQIQNKGQRFAPGEYGTVEFALPKRVVLVVPRDAVVDSGMATYVFVDEGHGRFSPRSVSIGQAFGEDVAIDAGIDAGERVVSGATFLIDSESRLQASAQERHPEAVEGLP